MEKINIAEFLRNCPKGMELDCTMFENVTFEEVVTEVDCDGNENISIVLATHYNDGMVDKIILTEYGTYTSDETAKCVIFPKGKTTWEGFVPHWLFKNGDVIVTGKGRENECVAIFKFNSVYEGNIGFHYHSLLSLHTTEKVFEIDDWAAYISVRLATEEEKQKLFDAIKENGYKWNYETKTLVKLPKFKVGDRIVDILRKHMGASGTQGIISEITDDKYIFTDGSYISISDQDSWELVPDKFDITTLKPFDKVLVRDKNEQEWFISFFSHCNGLEHYKYSCVNGSGYAQCVPYEQNEHLRGTTNDCDDFYKTWEK